MGSDGTASLRNPTLADEVTARHVKTVVPADWRARFSDAYAAELQAWIGGLERGEIVGPSAWTGTPRPGSPSSASRRSGPGSAWRPTTLTDPPSTAEPVPSRDPSSGPTSGDAVHSHVAALVLLALLTLIWGVHWVVVKERACGGTCRR